MADRPAPSWEAPEGHEHIAVEEGPDWQPDTTRRCRYTIGPGHRACGRQSTVALLRGSSRKSWWGYCGLPGHAYGRWAEDGKVMHWIVRLKAASDG